MRFVKIVFLGLLLFVVQLLHAISIQQSVLTAKSTQIAVQTLTSVMVSTNGAAWFVYYFLLGVFAHAAMVACALVFSNWLIRLKPEFNVRGFRVLIIAVFFWAVALVNGRYFPNAALSVDYIGVAGFWLGISILTLYFVGIVVFLRVGVLAAGAVGVVASVCFLISLESYSGLNRDRPDVIILGVDSLRHDHVYMHKGGEYLLPNIRNFVNSSVEFERAYTPMARTYVAYASLLTGKYPVNHGVRENLYPHEFLDRSWILPGALSGLGYRSVLAMDESRFANLDVSFGFDVHAMPPSSGLDFVLAGAMDTLGTNILHLIPGGWRLMPHVAGNRAGHTAYSPEVHSRRVVSALRKVDKASPLFLVSHHCIAHTPFWPGDIGPLEGSLPEYAAALKVADAQVGEVMAELRRSGRLENAIVILISDHGEGLGLESDSIDTSRGQRQVHYGHGYPVYDLKQSHVLFAVQHYVGGRASLAASRVDRVVSLVDIAPTVMALLGEGGRKFDGVALIDKGRARAIDDRYIYVESGIYGPSLQRRNVNPGEVIEEFAGMYKLDGDGRFLVTDETIEYLDGFKQRMAISDADMHVWLPGCNELGCLQQYNEHARRLTRVADGSKAADALCLLYRHELSGICSDNATISSY